MFMAYRKDEFPWPQIISELIDEPDLTALRDDDLPMAEVTKDSESVWHRRAYANFALIEEKYRIFVAHIASRLLKDIPLSEILYQRVPTFRVSLPGNMAVGEFHRDTDYGHTPEEINCWVPCTPAYGSNTLHIDGEPVFIDPGEIFVFAGSALHGNVKNETDSSRVSFDFRLLRRAHFIPNDRRSHNLGTRMIIGEYWSEFDCL
jgi:ectoine hydroxylase-related dioxygenase (phytanoyl-CoA dioxygenase family)